LCTASQSRNSSTSQFAHIQFGHRSKVFRTSRQSQGTREVLDVSIGLVTVRPVALDGDERELLLLDEPGSQSRAPAVELRGPVGGFPDQDVFSVAESLDESIEVVRVVQFLSSRPNVGNGCLDIGGFSPRCSVSNVVHCLV